MWIHQRLMTEMKKKDGLEEKPESKWMKQKSIVIIGKTQNRRMKNDMPKM